MNLAPDTNIVSFALRQQYGVKEKMQAAVFLMMSPMDITKNIMHNTRCIKNHAHLLKKTYCQKYLNHIYYI
jgi:hypothetical protein